MSQNKEAENLDDIFLIKDKNKPKTNKFAQVLNM